MDSIEIGLFQLENLILMRSPFLFFNLTHQDMQTSDRKLTSYLAQAVAIRPDRLLEHLKKEKANKDFPLVLLCEDGATSRKSATALESKGFSNVYVVDGGLQGLLREAQASKR